MLFPIPTPSVFLTIIPSENPERVHACSQPRYLLPNIRGAF